MISEKITDVKKFMSKLLLSDAFNEFLINEVSISTFNTFTINGHINKDFFSKEEYENLNENKLSYWKDVKSFCYNIIKGNKTPLQFKIIFAINKQTVSEILNGLDTTIKYQDINELFLNIKFLQGQVTYTTGTSLNIFTLDKSVENAFDSYILKFISTLF